ncbi:hypothetical protein KDD30_23275 (plasmid) [Photobacterium sp. GJ3]|uniref:hypothetical protein n=1 Tax=Photobacterium sp. GJ3 TaxID=2829502 RepID=UPI001B8AD97B|nr:hypothetical protein [Photobacterium sp. GJ3]QUJ69654.1 hypothetical protein KDD30_23275 [Photobacterium sp. GJ3]
MAVPAKDIEAIYASYKLPGNEYVETTEREAYVRIQRKWLILREKWETVISADSERSMSHDAVRVTEAGS